MKLLCWKSSILASSIHTGQEEGCRSQDRSYTWSEQYCSSMSANAKINRMLSHRGKPDVLLPEGMLLMLFSRCEELFHLKWIRYETADWGFHSATGSHRAAYFAFSCGSWGAYHLWVPNQTARRRLSGIPATKRDMSKKTRKKNKQWHKCTSTIAVYKFFSHF